ncbi:hypothetical protein LPJ73_000710 [Coemansia sp. RSA 2703]|nr:hypothetical protein LPJ73_000710 [Coemansia sp. RSA 2703]KAJ2378808.1 hypothetical protein IW150_000565 [Coemansia sp. RSA 2607]
MGLRPVFKVRVAQMPFRSPAIRQQFTIVVKQLQQAQCLALHILRYVQAKDLSLLEGISDSVYYAAVNDTKKGSQSHSFAEYSKRNKKPENKDNLRKLAELIEEFYQETKLTPVVCTRPSLAARYFGKNAEESVKQQFRADFKMLLKLFLNETFRLDERRDQVKDKFGDDNWLQYYKEHVLTALDKLRDLLVHYDYDLDKITAILADAGLPTSEAAAISKKFEEYTSKFDATAKDAKGIYYSLASKSEGHQAAYKYLVSQIDSFSRSSVNRYTQDWCSAHVFLDKQMLVHLILNPAYKVTNGPAKYSPIVSEKYTSRDILFKVFNDDAWMFKKSSKKISNIYHLSGTLQTDGTSISFFQHLASGEYGDLQATKSRKLEPALENRGRTFASVACDSAKDNAQQLSAASIAKLKLAIYSFASSVKKLRDTTDNAADKYQDGITRPATDESASDIQALFLVAEQCQAMVVAYHQGLSAEKFKVLDENINLLESVANLSDLSAMSDNEARKYAAKFARIKFKLPAKIATTDGIAAYVMSNAMLSSEYSALQPVIRDFEQVYSLAHNVQRKHEYMVEVSKSNKATETSFKKVDAAFVVFKKLFDKQADTSGNSDGNEDPGNNKAADDAKPLADYNAVLKAAEKVSKAYEDMLEADIKAKATPEYVHNLETKQLAALLPRMVFVDPGVNQIMTMVAHRDTPGKHCQMFWSKGAQDTAERKWHFNRLRNRLKMVWRFTPEDGHQIYDGNNCLVTSVDHAQWLLGHVPLAIISNADSNNPVEAENTAAPATNSETDTDNPVQAVKAARPKIDTVKDMFNHIRAEKHVAPLLHSFYSEQTTRRPLSSDPNDPGPPALFPQLRYEAWKYRRQTNAKLGRLIRDKFRIPVVEREHKPHAPKHLDPIIVLGDWVRSNAHGRRVGRGIGLRRDLHKMGFQIYLLDEFKTSSLCPRCACPTEYAESRFYPNRPKFSNKTAAKTDEAPSYEMNPISQECSNCPFTHEETPDAYQRSDELRQSAIDKYEQQQNVLSKYYQLKREKRKLTGPIGSPTLPDPTEVERLREQIKEFEQQQKKSIMDHKTTKLKAIKEAEAKDEGKWYPVHSQLKCTNPYCLYRLPTTEADLPSTSCQVEVNFEEPENFYDKNCKPTLKRRRWNRDIMAALNFRLIVSSLAQGNGTPHRFIKGATPRKPKPKTSDTATSSRKRPSSNSSTKPVVKRAKLAKRAKHA